MNRFASRSGLQRLRELLAKDESSHRAIVDKSNQLHTSPKSLTRINRMKGVLFNTTFDANLTLLCLQAVVFAIVLLQRCKRTEKHCPWLALDVTSNP